jgi:CheY-like chemotaxis protein
MAGARSTTERYTVPIPIRRTPTGPPSREDAKAQGLLLLVAEDNEDNQKVINRQLGLLGYAADMASSGTEALALWKTGDYSILLADLHMPEMDGYQLTAAIRAQESATKHSVIIALTADVLKGGGQQCRDAGMDDYLCKPARLSELRGMLEKWTSNRRSKTSDGPAPAPIPSSSAPPVDPSVLEELVGNDPSVVREFLRAFWTSTAKTTSELREAVQARRVSLVGDLAHKLKSPAKSVGAMPLAALCEELEHSARTSDFGAIEKCLPRFEAEEERVEAYLRGV